MNRQVFVILVFLILILVLSALRFQLLTKLNVQSDDYEKLLKQIDVLKKSNEQLREEVLIRSSLTTINQEAIEQGFTSEKILVLP